MLIVCSNGNPVRIRTAKNHSGYHLRDLGYHDFQTFVRYDICHTKSRHVRMVKAYRYEDDSYDVRFYTASLKPIEGIGTLYHVPEDPSIRQFCAKTLNRMLNKAIFYVNKKRKEMLEEELPF